MTTSSRPTKQCAAILAALLILLAAHNPARAQSAAETIAAVQPRIVKIYGAGGIKNLQAYATGVLVSAEGHVATVWSHVLDEDEVLVVMDDGRRFQAKVLGAEPQLDLGMLKIQGENLNLPHFDLETEIDTAAPGTRILAFSNMFKVAAGPEPVSVLHGVISAKTKLSARRGVFEVPYDGTVYVVDAITNNPGAAGGVIVNREGKLLGMIGKELRNQLSNTWINYAVPFPEFKDVIEQIKTGDYTERKREDKENPRRYATIDFGLVMVPDVVFRTPAYVDTVLPGSDAEKAGLETEDLVLFVNDDLVQSNRDLKEILGWLEAGDTLRLIVRRGSQLKTVEMFVEPKEE